ncbi:MAG TPA: right-handed parallel beta-helix repeat-containing protein [Vicinamibacterales bacterium]|nr:right-handed parallel beta-helix repeat-containing protein [Vicinamibacterales bacterium]
MGYSASGVAAAAVVLTGASLLASQPGLPRVRLTAGMIIDRSVRVVPGTYRLHSTPDQAAITIKGENITVDLSGVTILGGDPQADPDSYLGTGIAIDGGSRVTVSGAAVRGYKVGLLARRSTHLRLTKNDLSYNWKPRLWSGIEKESLADWLSYHQNEKDEWLRYGAGIYLTECDDAEIDNNRVVQGQNGLMVTRSSRLKIWNNTFSWNSGLGLGMYRTTDSQIVHNRLDWNVRGYSHGFYHRGQDSAAILMYEQTSRNTVAHNSATHGGDGLFLWAGQSTMDTGQGGANDNKFISNDFSHAVANGIEATFSRNTFAWNDIVDCWHGLWGGYSYDSLIHENTFSRNTDAIAIEHGQNNRIVQNNFRENETAIRLWANETQDPNWGYAKARDTRSRDYTIETNRFTGDKTALNVLRTSGVRARWNTFTDVALKVQPGVAVASLEFEPPNQGYALFRDPFYDVPRPAGAINAKLPAGARRGRSTIIVDEWGPFDYRSPKIWPTGKPEDRPMRLRMLGPAGIWSLKAVRGGTTRVEHGTVPDEIFFDPTGPGADVQLDLEYKGQEDVLTPRGTTIKAGTPVTFSYSMFEPAIDWEIKFWKYENAADPIADPAAFAARLRETPDKTERATRLSYLTSRALADGLPNDRVALRAEGIVDLPRGVFDLTVLSDDGVRVWADDRLVIDRWTVHESDVDRARLSAGRHRLKIEYFEATGWAELQVRFARAAADR